MLLSSSPARPCFSPAARPHHTIAHLCFTPPPVGRPPAAGRLLSSADLVGRPPSPLSPARPSSGRTADLLQQKQESKVSIKISFSPFSALHQASCIPGFGGAHLDHYYAYLRDHPPKANVFYKLALSSKMI
ncbi:hypothetical protein ABZP36_036208 [Zizania latifolia]